LGLSYFLALPGEAIFNYLLTVWPWPLGIGAAYLFFGGCLAQLFSKWGLIFQVIGLLLFIPFPMIFHSAVPLTLGLGFLLGSLSVLLIAFGYYSERKSAGITL
jgi:hypothetical protein